MQDGIKQKLQRDGWTWGVELTARSDKRPRECFQVVSNPCRQAFSCISIYFLNVAFLYVDLLVCPSHVYHKLEVYVCVYVYICSNVLVGDVCVRPYLCNVWLCVCRCVCACVCVRVSVRRLHLLAVPQSVVFCRSSPAAVETLRLLPRCHTSCSRFPSVTHNLASVHPQASPPSPCRLLAALQQAD